MQKYNPPALLYFSEYRYRVSAVYLNIDPHDTCRYVVWYSAPHLLSPVSREPDDFRPDDLVEPVQLLAVSKDQAAQHPPVDRLVLCNRVFTLHLLW